MTRHSIFWHYSTSFASSSKLKNCILENIHQEILRKQTTLNTKFCSFSHLTISGVYFAFIWLQSKLLNLAYKPDVYSLLLQILWSRLSDKCRYVRFYPLQIGLHMKIFLKYKRCLLAASALTNCGGTRLYLDWRHNLYYLFSTFQFFSLNENGIFNKCIAKVKNMSNKGKWIIL